MFRLIENYVSIKNTFVTIERVPSSAGKSSSGVSARTTGRTRSPVKRERGSRPPSASTASSSVAPSPAPATSGAPTVRKTSGAEKLRKDSVGGSSKESDTTATKDASTRRQRPSKNLFITTCIPTHCRIGNYMKIGKAIM